MGRAKCKIANRNQRKQNVLFLFIFAFSRTFLCQFKYKAESTILHKSFDALTARWFSGFSFTGKCERPEKMIQEVLSGQKRTLAVKCFTNQVLSFESNYQDERQKHFSRKAAKLAKKGKKYFYLLMQARLMVAQKSGFYRGDAEAQRLI